MSATAVSRGTSLPADRYYVTFGRTLRSEWVKFITLRSTIWTLAATVVLMVGLAALFAGVANPDDAVNQGGGSATDVSTTPFIVGAGFGQLALAVLGVLTITGEYSTGMIRSTFSAVPARTPAVVAKAVVVVGASLVVAIVSTALQYVVAAPFFSGTIAHIDLGNPDVLRVVLGVPLYLAATALLALAFGILIRSSAGAIFAVIGLILVIGPILTQIPLHWLNRVASYLPSQAGQQLLTVNPTEAPSPWLGYVVMLAWAVGLFVIGAVILKNRDA